MGLSKNKSDGFKTIILKLVSKEDGQNIPATLKALQKGESGKYEEFDRFTSINGNIVKIELKTESIPQQTGNPMDVDKVKIIFKDVEEQERYVLDLTYTNVTRSLFNSMLSLQPIEKNNDKGFFDVEFSFYQNKKSGYNTVSVKQSGERVSWKFDVKTDVPRPEKVIVNRKEQNDFTKVDDFYKEHLLNFIEANSMYLNEQSPSDIDSSVKESVENTTNNESQQPQQTKQPEPELVSSEESDVDDLPF